MPTLRIGSLILFSVAWTWVSAPAGELPPAPWSAGPPTPVAPGQASDSGVQEATPKVFYLKDRDGNLVPVPDFSFERYEQFVAQEIARNKSQPPAFSFADVIRLTGKANEQVAELQAVFPLRFTAPAADSLGWVQIPLRLDQAIVTKPPEFDGGGEVLLDYRGKGEGYVVWVRPDSQEVRKLTLHIKVPIKRANGQLQLSLATVRAPLNLQLEVARRSRRGKRRH